MVDPAGAHREAHGGGHPLEVWTTETPWLLRCGSRNVETRRVRLCVLGCAHGLADVEQGVGGCAVSTAGRSRRRGSRAEQPTRAGHGPGDRPLTLRYRPPGRFLRQHNSLCRHCLPPHYPTPPGPTPGKQGHGTELTSGIAAPAWWRSETAPDRRWRGSEARQIARGRGGAEHCSQRSFWEEGSRLAGLGGGAVDNAAAAAGRGVPVLGNPPRQATGPTIGP